MPENKRNRGPSKIRTLFIIGFLVQLTSCGVKGKPLPPLDPTFIGRGQPYIFSAPQPESEEEKRKKNMD